MIHLRPFWLGSSAQHRPTFVAAIRHWMLALVAGCVLLMLGQSQLFAASLRAPRATTVSGNILSQTWTVANSPYEVTGLLTVGAGQTLTIDPGVEVIVAKDTHIQIHGSLVAEGTQAAPITFSGSAAEVGWWYGIDVTNSPETLASVSLNYVTVQHAGYGAGLEVGYASATIRNSTFKDNSDHGIDADLYGPFVLENSTFTNNGLNGIQFGNGTYDPQLSNLSASGNGAIGEGYDAVVYSGMHWDNGVHTLEPMGLPYVLLNGFSVEAGSKVILAPGIKVQVENSFYVYGELVAIGTDADANSILITGINQTPGGWWGLSINGGDTLAKAQLEYVTLEYGGPSNSDSNANLMFTSADVTVRNSILRNGGQHGIFNSGGSPDEAISLVVENTQIANNLGSAVVCDDESCHQSFANLSGTGNGIDALVYRSIQDHNIIWSKAGFPYLIDGTSGIDEKRMMVIEPGVEILMGEDAKFEVSGSLSAIGTVEQPILFTPTQPVSGWWDSIRVNTDGSMELRYCDVGYGGRPDFGMLELGSNAVFVSNCKLHHSAEAAVRTVTNVTPIISFNQIEQNVAGVINGNGTAFPLTVDARYNWWGSATGPTHASNPGGTGDSVTDLVQFTPWLTTPEQTTADTLVVQIAGVGRYSPGETVQYAIAYSNATGKTVEDAVLRVALPANSTYVDSTQGGIHWPERKQMFWELGDLAPGAGGLLAVRVTYAWGLPDGLQTAIVAQLGARGVDEALFDIDEYLNYTSRFETTVTDLTFNQVQDLRAGDAKMDAIYDQAEADGYVYGSATKRIYNTGEMINQVILLRVVDEDVQAFILWQNETGTAGIAIDGAGLTAFKPGRGLRYSLQTKQWTEVAVADVAATQGLTWSECMLNCIEDKLPGETIEELIKVYSAGKKTVGCIKAVSGDQDGMLECSKVLDKVIPGYGTAVEFVTCGADCKECEESGGSCDNDKCHCCTEDKYRCASDDWLYGTLGIDVIKLRKCGENGIYLAEVVQTICALCEKCVMGSASPVCSSKSVLTSQVGDWNLTVVQAGLLPARADLTLVSGVTVRTCEECRKAKDPNEITGPTGDLLPGQLVTYTIEYENVGEGAAYGVFIVNPLSEHFDLETLAVQGDVEYSLLKSTHRIYFQVGDLDGKGLPGAKGQVTYSVRVKSGLPSGTVIINNAVVHFPSVPEETPTNTVVNTIQPIAVPNQQLQVAAEQALPIVLTGKDVSDGALSFAVVGAPVYGTLSGNAPTLTYTPQPNFAGIDRVRFTASNGPTTSRVAEVVIEVLAAGGDGVAPTVKWTGPTNGEVVNYSQLAAHLEDGTPLFTPYLQIQFSEAMAVSTINTNTIEVKNGAGQVVPISVQYDGTVDQAVVLMHQAGEAGATYTVTVKNSVTDLAGTPMATDYVWSFQFGSLVAETPNLYLPFTQR